MLVTRCIHLLFYVAMWLRGFQATCTPSTYSRVTDCDIALASGSYPNCDSIPNSMVNHRIICELQTSVDLVTLKTQARILYKGLEQACVLTDCSTTVICAPVTPGAYVCVEKLATPGTPLVETKGGDMWSTEWAVEYTYETSSGTTCPYKGLVNIEPCVNNQFIHGGGKQYGGCTLTGEFMAATLIMRRQICIRIDWVGFVRTNTMMFGQYMYKAVLCPNLNSYIVTAGGYAEAFIKSANFPGALS